MNEKHYDAVILSPNSAVDSYYSFSEFSLGAVNRASDTFHTAGGKGLNMARAMMRLGARPLCLGLAGGSAAQLIKNDLDSMHIPYDFVITKEESRRSNTVYVEHMQDTTVLLEQGRAVDEASIAHLNECIDRHIHEAPFFVMTGSLLPGFEPDYYAGLVRRYRSGALKCCLDTSNDALKSSLAVAPDLLKINREEFVSAFPVQEFSPSFALSRFEELEKQGMSLMIITDGARGSYVFSSDSRPFHVRTHVEGIVSSAGSGDTFMAGLIAALSHGKTIDEASVYASAAASANLLELGCGFFDVNRVPAFIDRTEIQAC